MDIVLFNKKESLPGKELLITFDNWRLVLCSRKCFEGNHGLVYSSYF